MHDIGIGKGKNYAVNVPLKDGIDDETYRNIFRPVNHLVRPIPLVKHLTVVFVDRSYRS